MSLGHSVYYVIKPNDSLLGMAAERALDGDYFLTDPQVWERVETTGDHSAPAERTAYVKALFLAWFHHEYLSTLSERVPDEFDLRLQEMLGAEPFTPSVFDRWWSIERYGDYVMSEEEVLRHIGVESLRKVATPGVDYSTRLLSYWLENKTTGAKKIA